MCYINEILTWNEINPDLGFRFLVNLFAVFVLVRLLYFPRYRKTEFFLTFGAFNLIIFLVAYLLNKVEMTTGAAFGLFAVFSILRYRTEGISARDMTYLFLSIAIGLITAVSKGNWIELILFCLLLLTITFILESRLLAKRECAKSIHYDTLSGIKPEENAKLIEDLKNRTGLQIHRVEIHTIDFLKDSCSLTVYYYE